MSRQPRVKKKSSTDIGTGDVTPKQIAFIVDRYLFDNNFSQTRSLFRTEAASLIAQSPSQEATKGILGLGQIINEYISLKAQKLMVDQERARLEQDKFRVQTLLQSMQNAMTVYSATGSSSTPAAIVSAAHKPAIMASRLQSVSGSQADVNSDSGNVYGIGLLSFSLQSWFPLHNNPTVQSMSMPSNTNAQPTNNKRKNAKVVSNVPPPAGKRSRSKFSAPEKAVPQHGSAVNSQENTQAPSSAVETSPNICVASGSNVVKCLFNQPSFSIPTNTSVPKTPPRANSSQSDKSTSPLDVSKCSNASTPADLTPTRCTVISSSKRVTLSPCKQMAFYMEKNQCISTSSPAKTNSKRQTTSNNPRRLDFSDSDPLVNLGSDEPIVEQASTSESEKEIDLFDIDLPNFDVMGDDFSFTEMLGAFDFDCGEMDYSCQPPIGASMDTISGSSPESMCGYMGSNQVISEFSSVTEVLSQQDMSMQGPDSTTALKSVTRCIKIISPVKSRGSSMDQNCTSTN
ncbi:hypothetical protein F8388_003463 [Cannabis sativa]|uniref:LisH domain-containing protein n=1 Tax=Cannabis sativa TaxID=3483 RepID=A0A7J6F4Z8_CANSA|nr:hypothetical protein F8388_003463 [Cannabis sativa]KAF4380488.1 hypothetical protein G4B88_011734 [Cannabis sativa]